MDHANGPASRLTISLPQPSPLQFELMEDGFQCEPLEGDGSTTAPIVVGTRVEQLQRPRHFSFGNAPKAHSKGAVGMKLYMIISCEHILMNKIHFQLVQRGVPELKDRRILVASQQG